MTKEEMQKYLTKIQEQSSQTKMLNAILACFNENKNLEKMIIEIQQKVNEIIEVINKKNAETVNEEEDLIVNDIAAASQEQQNEL